MSGTRVPFDLSLPFIVAAPALSWGARTFARGAEFPWRELGVTEFDLVQLWTANQVDAAPLRETAMKLPGVSSAELAAKIETREIAMKLTPSERVSVETPAQASKRRTRS